MKNNLFHTLLLCAAALVAATTAHAEKVIAGPKGGRLLDREPAPVEFFVNAERKAEVLFYGADLKPAQRGTQVVSVTIEKNDGKTRVELAPTSQGFVSTTPLPEGPTYRIVVQVRAAAGAKPKNYRVDLNLGYCAGCKRAEYACTCESH